MRIIARRDMNVCIVCLVAVLSAVSAVSHAGEWRGNVAAEYRWFVNDGAYAGQQDSYSSIAFEPEYIHDWNNGYDLFTFKAFYRQDQHDDERTHGDIRELSYLHAGDDWEVLVGIGKVFWGVTESIHLVDIINQSDTVENLDGEDKLGQPMIQYTLLRDWGVLSGFVLPGFRERTFPGVEGRPRFASVVDTDNPVYEDDDEDRHIDFAIHYSHTLGDWDLELSHFHGTSRDPRLQITPVSMTAVSVQPVYDIIDQTGLLLQATIGDWLWKLEAIHRSGQGESFSAAAGGYEYTFVGVFESDMDIGLIMEYLWDERDTSFAFPTSMSPVVVNTATFANDLVVGARLTLNDAQSTEVLASMIGNLEGDGLSYNIEASRRIGDDFTLSLEARGVSDLKPASSLAQLAEDNRVSLELAWFF